MARMYTGFRYHVDELLTDFSLCDVTVVVDNDKKTADNNMETVSVQAHRLILVVMSNYFRRMLQDKSSGDNQSEIRLVGVSHSSFMRCLRFMYCGFDQQIYSMSLDESLEFYSTARKLEIDDKLKENYSTWITNNISNWEKRLWTILSMAYEYDLPSVVQRCKEYITDIANEVLLLDEFCTIPLPVVQMILSCDKMNCTKIELTKAVETWITTNHTDDPNELLNTIQSKEDQFFKGEEENLYLSLSITHLNPADLSTAKRINISSNAEEHQYTSYMTFRKCIMLVGVTVVFVRNNEQLAHDEIGSFELKVQIGNCWQYVLRTVNYDFTQCKAQKVAIFFPEMKCCAKKKYLFNFSWKCEGAQPIMYMFGPVDQHLAEADKSLLWSIYHHQVSDNDTRYCRICEQYAQLYGI